MPTPKKQRKRPPLVSCSQCGREAEYFTVDSEEGVTQVLVCPRCGMVEDTLMEMDDITGRH